MKIKITKEVITSLAEEVSREAGKIVTRKVAELEDEELIEQLIAARLPPKETVVNYLTQTPRFRFDDGGQPFAQVENGWLLRCFPIKLHDLKAAREELEREGRAIAFENQGRIQIRFWLPEQPVADNRNN